MERQEVLKTYKLYIGGQFPRTESGRYYELRDKKKNLLANICLSSRKDFRNAVTVARSAFAGWSNRSAFNRSQILYRMAEMLEGRKHQLKNELLLQGSNSKQADEEIRSSIDRLVYYAGWCDKFSQIYSSVNPVASPHFNFSVPEPMGVIAVIAPEQHSLLGIVSCISPIIAGGNTCVVLASETKPLSAITFSEVLATSDLPAGVVNVLTGNENELLTHFSSHMDVNAFVYSRNNKDSMKLAEENAALNVKRTLHWRDNWTKPSGQGPDYIMDLQEIKTTWHPIEKTGVGGAKY